MAAFAFAAALLVAGVLALVLPPLWRDARRTAGVLALALVLGTAGLYGLLGAPAALDPDNVALPETLDEAIAQLERRLAEEPGSVEGWILLGRSRMSQQRYADGRDAFQKAHELLPADPDIQVELADAQMRAAPDGRFPQSAVDLLEGVVAAFPQHQRALFYLGAQRLQAGRVAEAAALWERLLPLLDERTAGALRPQIAMAREQAGLPPLVEAPVTAPLTVTVELSPAMAEHLAPGDTLFVFARPADGAGPPVAVKRLTAADFPLTLGLSDADSLMPTQKLSEQSSVQVMARVSKTGNAQAAAGDLVAEPRVIELAGDAKITLVIDRVQP